MPTYSDRDSTYRLTQLDYLSVSQVNATKSHPSETPSDVTNTNLEDIIHDIINNGENVRIMEKKFAELLHEFFKNYFLFSKKEKGKESVWYMFRDHHWYYVNKDTMIKTIAINVKSFCRYYMNIIKKQKQDLEDKSVLSDTINDIDNRLSGLELNSGRTIDFGFINEIYKNMKAKFYDPEIVAKLDKKTLLCFENGVLDLKTCTFRDGKMEDYCTKSCCFDLTPIPSHSSGRDSPKVNKKDNKKDNKKSEDNSKKLDNLLNSIFPSKKMKTMFLTQMCYGIFGKNMKYSKKSQIEEDRKVHLPVIFATDGGFAMKILIHLIELCFNTYVDDVTSDDSPILNYESENRKIMFVSTQDTNMKSFLELTGQFFNDKVKFFVYGEADYWDTYQNQNQSKKFPRINLISKNLPNLMDEQEFIDMRCPFVNAIIARRKEIMG